LLKGIRGKLIECYTTKLKTTLHFKPNYLISLGIAISFLKGIVVYNLGAILLIILLNFVSLEADYNIGLYACILITVATAYFIDYFENIWFIKNISFYCVDF